MLRLVHPNAPERRFELRPRRCERSHAIAHGRQVAVAIDEDRAREVPRLVLSALRANVQEGDARVVEVFTNP